jgi:DNA-binding response OmpR family regulator
MKKILLIEDDKFISDIYSTKLKASGFSVETAVDLEESVRKLKASSFDLILLDLILPNQNGWDIFELIEKDDKMKDLKIIICSNLSQKEEVEKAMKMGAVKYLIKANYTPTEIVEEIKKVLS